MSEIIQSSIRKFPCFISDSIPNKLTTLLHPQNRNHILYHHELYVTREKLHDLQATSSSFCVPLQGGHRVVEVAKGGARAPRAPPLATPLHFTSHLI